MILSKTVFIKIATQKLKLYKELGYNPVFGDLTEVKINDLTLGSHAKVDVKCDICKTEKSIKYRDYNKNIKNYNFYACSEKCSKEKTFLTKEKKYGNRNYNDILKIKKTIKDIYGVECVFSLSEYRQKANETKKILYNDYNYNNRPKALENWRNKTEEERKRIILKTSITKKNRPQELKNLQIKKFEETNLLRYGVKYPNQNSEIFERNQKACFKIKKHELTKLNYQSLNEKDFLDYCIANKIEVQKGKKINYIFNNKLDNVHYSDFFIEKYNLIVEIKSKYTFTKDLKRNLAKQNSAERIGYKYIFIIDFNYSELEDIIKIN